MKNFLIGVLFVAVIVFGYLAFKSNPHNNQQSTSISANTQSVSDALSIVTETLQKGYISSQTWPPAIHNSPVAYTTYICAPDSVSGQKTITEKTINGRKYCITSLVDGGAGHWGGEYKYVTENYSNTKYVEFTLNWPSCGGYDSPASKQCEKDQSTVFENLDNAIDNLMRK